MDIELQIYVKLHLLITISLTNNQSGAAEAWWAHNPQVLGSKPGSDILEFLLTTIF